MTNRQLAADLLLRAVIIVAAVVAAVNMIGCATPIGPELSPLGHRWEARFDASLVGAFVTPAGSGTGHYNWCTIHNRKPANDAEAIDAMLWVASHPKR